MAKRNIEPNSQNETEEVVIQDGFNDPYQVDLEDKKALKAEKKNEKRIKKIEKKEMKHKNRKAKKNKNINLDNVERYSPTIDMGLSDEIVSQRVEQGLANDNHSGSTKSIKKIIFTNVFTFFNLLTVAIAGWLISVKAFTDLFFLVIVTANVVIGIIQEIKAKNTIDKLSLMQAPTAIVIRNGEKREIAVSEVVLDDILYIESGRQIPSDCIVLEGTMEANESLLTGESDAIAKKKDDLLYAGSYSVSGNCYARVDKVGKGNYIEQLTGEAKQYKKPKSDLLKSLNWIILVMACIIIPIGALLFYTQYVTSGVDYITAVRKTAGAMIGMIPSGLYLLSSVALAVGVIRLAENNVMVQELYCIEMLARVNVLCLDKTGTITDGTMSVKNVIEFNTIPGLSTKNIISSMLNALNDSNLTSVALEEKFGKNKRLKHVATIPFSSQRKLNAVSFERYGTFVLGAPEFVMKADYDRVKNDVERYAGMGYRVLLLTHKEGIIEDNTLPQGENEVIAMILIEDNIRPDAVKTISYFKESGVEVKVISGDNPLTVSKISERAGITNADKYISLDGLRDDEVIRAASEYTVFGRVSPAQKRLLIKTLKSEGKTVAMTGDGVNDILALKEADCSIAVASGSEAARNVSHLVLLDSNFDSMPKVVAEGRRVINNVSAVACLFLTKTIFSLFLAIQAINSGGTYPISTNQLIMIDFLVIGIPSAILVLEPNNREVDGKFMTNIIKGALPGAIAILIFSIISFKLVEYLGLDFLTSSTIIVIVATHTCLMVLFKVCRPFNTLRKVLCTISYTLFLAITLLLPNFLEFRPFFKPMQYHSDSVVTKTIENVPNITISDDWYFVLDGELTDVNAKSSDTTYKVTSYLKDGKTYLSINGIKTNYEIKMPLLSKDTDDKVFMKGFNTEINNFVDENNELELKINKNGQVVIVRKHIKEGTTTTIETKYQVLPKITLNGDKLVFDGIRQDNLVTNIKRLDSYEINPETYELIINGETYTYLNTETGRVESYKFAKPIITVSSDEKLILNASPTELKLNSSELPQKTLNEIENSDVIKVVGDKYKINQKVVDVTIVIPTIQTSEKDHYVINGMYTEYKVKSIGGDSSLTLNFTEDEYLTINGLVTNYKVIVKETVGGLVQPLSIQADLILISLCLLASPLMRLLQEIIPWIKKSIKTFQDAIAKF